MTGLRCTEDDGWLQYVDRTDSRVGHEPLLICYGDRKTARMKMFADDI